MRWRWGDAAGAAPALCRMIVIGLVESLSIMTECRGDGRRARGGGGVSVDEETAPVSLSIGAHTFSIQALIPACSLH